MTTRLEMRCTECGSTDVRRDGYVAGCVPLQTWELVTTFDNTDCESCGCARELVGHLVETPTPAVGNAPQLTYAELSDAYDAFLFLHGTEHSPRVLAVRRALSRACDVAREMGAL